MSTEDRLEKLEKEWADLKAKAAALYQETFCSTTKKVLEELGLKAQEPQQPKMSSGMIYQRGRYFYIAASAASGTISISEPPFVMAGLSESTLWSNPKNQQDLENDGFQIAKEGTTIKITVGKDGQIANCEVKED